MIGLRLLLAVSVSLATACAGKVAAPAFPGATRIVLSEDEAPTGYVELGHLSVQSGKGCGVLGTAGSRSEADAKLRDEAAKLGANFVRLTSVEEPRPNHQCMEHEYKLSGTAFRSPTSAPATPPTPDAPPSPTAVAPTPTTSPVPAPAPSSAVLQAPAPDAPSPAR